MPDLIWEFKAQHWESDPGRQGAVEEAGEKQRTMWPLAVQYQEWGRDVSRRPEGVVLWPL